MKKIEPFSIKFGTPKPVPFVERYETPGVAVDVAGRIAGQVDVSECDRKAFTSGQDPAVELKSMMPQLISVAFAKMSETSVVKNIEERAARELESLMAERGITAKVKIVSFLLTEESEKTLKAALGIDDNRNEVFRTSFRAEVQPDREELERDIGSVRREVYEVPREAFLGEVNYRFRPAAVPEGSTEKSQEMPLKSDSERPLEQAAGKPVARFCSRCGARRNPAARFCVKCGAKFED
ncbi:MAG: zinc ribbon domain-containing protein [Clostridia bacterium]|nr:zinc ribbon domain-containing protein [Clostridia bacterium]